MIYKIPSDSANQYSVKLGYWGHTINRNKNFQNEVPGKPHCKLL